MYQNCQHGLEKFWHLNPPTLVPLLTFLFICSRIDNYSLAWNPILRLKGEFYTTTVQTENPLETEFVLVRKRIRNKTLIFVRRVSYNR